MGALKLILKGSECLEKQNNPNKNLSENFIALSDLKNLRLAKKGNCTLGAFQESVET